ncbi:MAG: prolyl oligopeptidase family serine peptidase [Erythrobacter sp.]
MTKTLTTLLAAALLAAPAFAESGPVTSPPMQALDLVAMPRLGPPAVSPDGRFAAYRVTLTDRDTLARSSEWYLIDLANPDAKSTKLDLGGSAADLVFGQDGAVYFLSDRAAGSEDPANPGANRLWRAELKAGAAGAAALVADFGATSIDGFKLAPSGKRVAVWAAIARDCPRFGCEGDGKRHLPGPGSGRLYDGNDGFVRHWDRWTTPGTVNRIFVFDVVDGKVTGDGTPADGIDPASGLKGDAPSLPYGGGEEIAWAPDSSGIYFVARKADVDEPRSTDLDIYWSGLAGAAPSELTAANAALDTAPAPSPDGRWLAYLAMARPGYEADRQVIQLRYLKTGETRALTQAFDRSFESLAWTPDSRWIIATAGDVLDTPAFRIDPRSGKVERLDLMAGNEAHVSNIAALTGERLLFTRDSIGSPHEIYLSQGWQQARPLTDVAMTRTGALASTVTTRFSFVGAGGAKVWGQITRLERQSGPIPAILYIHGGPQGSFNDSWSNRWNPRALASQGYAVISVDFHGSTGFGQAFTDAINRDWGGKPLEDLKLGFEAALKLDPQIDGGNACAMGASYGGYMVNWIAGMWPDRFKCLVNHNGLFDTRAFYFSTEEQWFPRWDFGGSYADAAATYEKWNPVNHVDKWQTPMLVVLGEKDFRVPYTQGLGAFTALQEREVPAQLLVFPDENHWVLGARNSLQWHNTVFDWLGRWLKPASPAE